MGHDFYHPAVYLKQALERIAERHLTAVEAADMDCEKGADELLQRIENTDKKQFLQLAAAIHGDDMDKVLCALKRDINDDTKRKLIFIIGHHKHKSLFALNWTVLQNDYHNSNLLDSMSLLCDFMKRRYKEEYMQSLPGRLEGSWDRLLYKTGRIMSEEGLSPREFMDKYQISEDSMLGKELYTAFFSSCDTQGFKDSRELFFSIIKDHSCSEINIAVDNYLKYSGELDFSGEINTILLETYGEPSDSNPFWKLISEGSRQKFFRWYYIKWLENYFGKNSSKFSFWNEYGKSVHNFARNEKDEVLFIRLGGLVVVESRQPEQECLLYSKGVYERKYPYGSSTSGETQYAIPKGAIMAKEAVLDNITAEIYVLSLNGVGRLYARELMKRELSRI